MTIKVRLYFWMTIIKEKRELKKNKKSVEEAMRKVERQEKKIKILQEEYKAMSRVKRHKRV